MVEKDLLLWQATNNRLKSFLSLKQKKCKKNYKITKERQKKKITKIITIIVYIIGSVHTRYFFLISFYLYSDPFFVFNILTLMLVLLHDEEVHALRRDCIYLRSGPHKPMTVSLKCDMRLVVRFNITVYSPNII